MFQILNETLFSGAQFFWELFSSEQSFFGLERKLGAAGFEIDFGPLFNPFPKPHPMNQLH
jgi:hypothetical protein